jgi:hypothetical protein
MYLLRRTRDTRAYLTLRHTNRYLLRRIRDTRAYLTLHTAIHYFNDLQEESRSINKKKGIPVTGREGPKGCETSRLPHFLLTICPQMAVK